MPDVSWNKTNWETNYNWSQLGEEWSAAWGSSDAQWFGTLLPRLRQFLPSGSVLEIAPGHGRWTKFLLNMSSQYYGVDVSNTCVEHCKKRFPGSGAQFFANDGTDLSMIADGSIDLVFSFDSLVHAEREVLEAYIPQVLSKLRKDGVAFFHHSNMAALVPLNVGDRARSVDAAVVYDIVRRAGGHALRQEIIKWDSYAALDCLTLFARNTDYAGSSEPVINNEFMAEAANCKAYIQPWNFRKIADPARPHFGEEESPRASIPSRLFRRIRSFSNKHIRAR